MQKDLSPEEKRKNLAATAGKPQIGRRESPDADVAEDSKARRRRIINGIILGAVVVAVVAVIIAVAGNGYQI